MVQTHKKSKGIKIDYTISLDQRPFESFRTIRYYTYLDVKIFRIRMHLYTVYIL